MIFGTPGDDQRDGTTANDLFFLEQGGSDSARGFEGDDGFYFGGALDPGDMADGGAGENDQVALQGNYIGVATLAATQFPGIEAFALLPGNDTRFGDPGTGSYTYNLALSGAWNDGVVFNVNGLRSGENFTFNAAATSTGTFRVFGGFGIERLAGGAGDDGFFFGGGRYNPAADKVDGGGGIDNQIALRGDYSTKVTFAADALVNINTIVLLSATDARYAPSAAPFNYNLTLVEGNVGSGANAAVTQLTVNGQGLSGAESMTVTATAVIGNLRLFGGTGPDLLEGGRGENIIVGGLGADSLSALFGRNTFVYTDVAESRPGSSDTIFRFNSGPDKIDLGLIDADTTQPGNQDFTFIGSSAFSGTPSSPMPGQLRAYPISGSFFPPETYYVAGDVDGDGRADFFITLDTQDQPIRSDFIGINP